MARNSRHRVIRGVGVALAMLLFTAVCGAEPGTGKPLPPADPDVFPIGERLGYAVSWMGIRCGAMEIVSFSEQAQNGGSIYRIVVFARTSPFFDGVYRVRSRLDSYFDPVRSSSVRYEEHASEKHKRKEEIWRVDDEASEVVRIKNGDTTRISLDAERAYDPVAFIFRLRSIPLETGQRIGLGLMTSKGVVETDAAVTELKQVRTKLGRCDAAAVVPEPRDRMLFSKSGAIAVWIDRVAPHRPCRIEFDLSFGNLVAKLQSVGRSEGVDVEAEWAVWSAD